MKTFEQCCDEVAKKQTGYSSFTKWLDEFNGSVYDIKMIMDEAASLYREEGIKEAVEMAQKGKMDKDGFISLRYTESEILEKLKL